MTDRTVNATSTSNTDVSGGSARGFSADGVMGPPAPRESRKRKLEQMEEFINSLPVERRRRFEHERNRFKQTIEAEEMAEKRAAAEEAAREKVQAAVQAAEDAQTAFLRNAADVSRIGLLAELRGDRLAEVALDIQKKVTEVVNDSVGALMEGLDATDRAPFQTYVHTLIPLTFPVMDSDLARRTAEEGLDASLLEIATRFPPPKDPVLDAESQALAEEDAGGDSKKIVELEAKLAAEKQANEERLRQAEEKRERDLAQMRAELEAQQVMMRELMARLSAPVPQPPVAPSTAATAEPGAGSSMVVEAVVGSVVSTTIAAGPAESTATAAIIAAPAEAAAVSAAPAEAAAGSAEAAEAAADVERDEAEKDPESASGCDGAPKPGPRKDQDPEGGSGAAEPAAGGGSGAAEPAAGGGSGAAESSADPPSGGAGGGADETMVDAGQPLPDTIPIEEFSPRPGRIISSLSSQDWGDFDVVPDSQEEKDRFSPQQAQYPYDSPVLMASAVQSLAAAPAPSARRLSGDDSDAPPPPPATAAATVAAAPAPSARRLRGDDSDAPPPPPATASATEAQPMPHDPRVPSVRNTAVPAPTIVVTSSSSAAPAPATEVASSSSAAPATTSMAAGTSTAAPAPTGPFSAVMEAVKRYKDPASLVKISRKDSEEDNDLVEIPAEWKDKVINARKEYLEITDPFSQSLTALVEQGLQLNSEEKKELKSLKASCYAAVCRKHKLPRDWQDWAKQLQDGNVIPITDARNEQALLVRDVEKYLTNVQEYTPERMQRRNRELNDAKGFLLRRLSEMAAASLPSSASVSTSASGSRPGAASGAAGGSGGRTGAASGAAGGSGGRTGAAATSRSVPGGRLGARAAGPSKAAGAAGGSSQAAGAAGGSNVLKSWGNIRDQSIPKKSLSKEARLLIEGNDNRGPKSSAAEPAGTRRNRVAFAQDAAAAADPNA